MSSIFLLIPLALLLLCVALWAFVWAVRNDQFEDLDTAGSRILFDDERVPAASAVDAPVSREE